MLKTSQFRCPLWKGVGISTPGRHRDLHQLLRFIRVPHSTWWMARDSAEHWHSNRSNETDSVWGIAGCQAAYPKDLGVRVWKLRPIVIHLHLVLGSRLPFCWHISISLSSFLIINIYILFWFILYTHICVVRCDLHQKQCQVMNERDPRALFWGSSWRSLESWVGLPPREPYILVLELNWPFLVGWTHFEG